MDNADLLEKFVDFLNEFYKDHLAEAANEGKKSLNVDFSFLEKFDTSLADYFLDNPSEVMPMVQKAVKQIDVGIINENFRIRVFNLPEERNIRIRNVRSEHIGKFIIIEGFVKRASEVRPEVSEAIFQCMECGGNIILIQTERMMKTPIECGNPACRNRTAFKLVDQKLYDARWTVVEEPFEITEGERPSDLRIYLKEDLTTPKMQNKTDPGNRIKVTGILKELPRRVKGTPSRQMEIYLDAVHVESVETEWDELEISPENEQKILELAKYPDIYIKLRDSIAPAIYGLEDIKEAITLQLFSGETHVQKDRSRVRGDIHCLLVGDPSCLVADERVVMSDGTILKIGKMGTEHLQKINHKLHLGMGRKTGTAERFHIYKKQPIIEIVTETGKSIRGTCNQPVLLRNKIDHEWKRLDEIKLGDKVRVLPKIECRRKSIVPTKWKDYPYYHKSWHIKVPEFVDENLASLFGYIIADGWITERRVALIVNKDEQDIVPKLEHLFKECFNSPIKSYQHKRASPEISYYQVDRSHVAKLLQFLNEKRVPDSILQSGDDVVASFLKWLYEGDGTVFSKGRGRTSVSLKSNSLELLRDVQMLLLRFGIHSRILWENTPRVSTIKGRKIIAKPSGSLMVRRSESILKFAKHIGFVSEKKKRRLKEAVKYAKSHVHRIHKELTEKVVEINRLQPQDVFDVEVPIYHRFVANGVIVHNTAKSALMKVVSGLIPRGRYVSGKGVSVDFDDPIIFKENGVIKTDLIGKVIDKYYSKNETGFASNGKMIDVPCFNPQTLKMEWKPVTKVFRHFADGDIFKIQLRTGREVRVTGSHSIFTIEDSKIVAKKAGQLNTGDILLVPNKLPENDNKVARIEIWQELKKLNSKEIKFVEEYPNFIKSKFSAHKIPKTLEINEDLMRLLGYYISDGSIDYDGKNQFKVKFDIDRKDKETINDIKNISKKLFGVDAKVYERKDSKCNNIYIHDKIVCLILKDVIKVGRNAHTKRIPDIVFNVGSELQKWFLYALIKGDYGVTVSKSLMSDILYLFLLNGVVGSFTTKNINRTIKFPDGHESKVNGEYYELKSPKIKKLLEKQFYNSNLHSRVPIEFFQSDMIKIIGNNEYVRVSDSGFEVINSKFKKLIYNRLELIKNGIDLKSLSKVICRKEKSTHQYLKSLMRKGLVEKEGKIYKVSNKGRKLIEEIEFLSKLRNSDLAFLKIRKIEKVKPTSRFVYDLSVDKYENFVAGFGGVICHNTGAGLTATVVKDEEFLGGWVLEAGALVMTNRSMCCIDEFEKIEKTDLVALHEMMEQQTISIAKANIVATLPAMTSILAGGNPKLGRFDPYLPIKEQIDVPETILSRFDLKFALRDIPNPETDAKMTEHILQSRHFGEIEAMPIIDNETFKKYVAYARKNCHPKLSREAADEIKSFYLSLRERSGEDSPISITPRQYEALIRMAEASAKIQLRKEVAKEDALRSINLMKASLRQFGLELETGKIDIDRAEGAKATSAQRNRIRSLLTLLDDLEKTFGKDIPYDELIKSARAQGIETPDEILNKMQQEGYIYRSKPGVINKV